MSKKQTRKFVGWNDPLNKNVAEYLVAKRKEANLSQEQIAERMGVSRTVVTKMENASDNLSLTKLVRYVRALGAQDLKIPVGDGHLNISYQTLLFYDDYLFLKRMFRRLVTVGTELASPVHDGTAGSEIDQDPPFDQGDKTGSQDDAELPLTPAPLHP